MVTQGIQPSATSQPPSRFAATHAVSPLSSLSISSTPAQVASAVTAQGGLTRQWFRRYSEPIGFAIWMFLLAFTYLCLLGGPDGWFSSLSILITLVGQPMTGAAKVAAAAAGEHPRFAGWSPVKIKWVSECICVLGGVLILGALYSVKDYLPLLGAGMYAHQLWKGFVVAANCAACAAVLMTRSQIWRELRGAAEAVASRDA